MLIDWFTVAAQALNFLILLWLLRRFLYRPILNALDAREQRIAAELSDAAAKQKDAQHEREEFARKNSEFDQNQAARLKTATAEAAAERGKLIEAAHKVADATANKAREALLADAQRLDATVRQRIGEEVLAVARQALANLASASLEEHLADVFTRRLRALDDGTKQTLSKALRTASEPVLVRSAFALAATQRADIQAALHECSGVEIAPRFEVAPDLIAGIELNANGQKIAWSIADYLNSLQSVFSDALRERQPVPAAAGA